MSKYSLVTEVAEMVENFSISLEAFVDRFTTIEIEVKAAIENESSERYNNIKNTIKE